jgi:hypothetical protein
LTNFEANAKQNEVKINNRFSEELPADADETNVTRQVKTRFFVTPQIPSNPKVVHFSEEATWYFHRRHKIQ